MISKYNVLILMALLLFSCGYRSERSGEGSAQGQQQQAQTAYKIPVQVIVPRVGKLQKEITIYGNLAPVRETHLASQFGGRIVRLPFAEGDQVLAGQVVATLISPKVEALGQIKNPAAGKEMLPISVRARFSGTILRKFHFAGDVVSPGEPLVQIQDREQFFLWGQLPSVFLPEVHAGQPIVVRFPDFPRQLIRTKIEKIEPAVKPETQMARIRATLTNEKRFLKANLFATIHVIVGTVEKGILLPRNAVLRDSRGDFVFLKRGGKAFRQGVQVGLKTADTLEVRSGLAPTDSVIVTGNYELKDGVSVRALHGKR